MLSFLAASTQAASPAGTYKGSKSILGQTIDTTVTIDDATHMDFGITGPATIDCKNEAYSYDGKSVITVPGLNTAGDCVHDALKSAPVSIALEKITYTSSDTIEVEAKVSFLTITLILDHSGLLQVVSPADRSLWFDEFRAHFGRTYSSAAEHAARRSIFEENLELITERNGEGEAFHFVNQFSDMSDEEFRATHMGYRPKANITAVEELDLPIATSLGKSIDWREHSPKVLTPVKDQGQCGSCWAFSATEQIETDIALATGKLLTLSPQQITSCDKTDDGCLGGNTETAYAYVEKEGIESEKSYPYKSGKTKKNGKCEFSKTKTVGKISGYSTISSTKASEGKMLTQIQKSPISVCVDANKWQTYNSGVLGRTCGNKLDHCVQAVAYNAAKKYWVVRNSWGSDWGEKGYVYVKEGLDACGIAKDATIAKGAALSTEIETELA